LTVERHQEAQKMTHNKCSKNYSKLSENWCVTLIQHYRKKIKKKRKQRIAAKAAAEAFNMLHQIYVVDS